eukprot:780628-Pelagomonas_calceolata.AAC.1
MVASGHLLFKVQIITQWGHAKLAHVAIQNITTTGAGLGPPGAFGLAEGVERVACSSCVNEGWRHASFEHGQRMQWQRAVEMVAWVLQGQRVKWQGAAVMSAVVEIFFQVSGWSG